MNSGFSCEERVIYDSLFNTVKIQKISGKRKGKSEKSWPMTNKNLGRENGNFIRKNVIQKSWPAKNLSVPPNLGARSPPLQLGWSPRIELALHMLTGQCQQFQSLLLLLWNHLRCYGVLCTCLTLILYKSEAKSCPTTEISSASLYSVGPKRWIGVDAYSFIHSLQTFIWLLFKWGYSEALPTPARPNN